MTTRFLRSLKIISKRFVLLAVSVVLLLGLMQPAVLAASSNSEVEPGFAPGITQPVPGEKVDQLKEQRREWQSKASSLHDARNHESDSLGETLKEKLNLDEITEGYDPKRESEKAYQRDPLGTR